MILPTKPLSASDMLLFRGRYANLPIDRPRISVVVVVEDARTQFGRVDLLVRPVLGGEEPAWVTLDRCEILPIEYRPELTPQPVVG